jgi:hypothetical protein
MLELDCVFMGCQIIVIKTFLFMAVLILGFSVDSSRPTAYLHITRKLIANAQEKGYSLLYCI